MGRSIGSFDSNDGATPLVAGPIASVLALQARSSYWTSARGNAPGHWSPPGAHQKDQGTGGGRLLPASRLGPSGLPTPGLDRPENGTGGEAADQLDCECGGESVLRRSSFRLMNTCYCLVT